MLQKVKKLIFCFMIIALSIQGSFISVKAADIITPENPILLTLEKPVNNTTMTGDIFLKGWSFSDVPLEKVEVYVDDTLMGNADYGLARADIANRYPGLPNAANSGFTYKIRGLKDGKHVIKVVAINKNGKNGTSSTNVIVNNVKTPITGYASSSLTPQQMIKTLETYNKTKDYGYINNFVYTLIEEAKAEDIRSDILFSQIVLETSYLNFGGDVKDGQNNFAGIGATGNGNPGNSFPDVRTGLRVVVQHLKAYANTKPLVNTCVDPRFKYVTRGSAAYVEYLGMNENPNGFGWAASSGYGYDIISVLNRVKTLSAPVETSKISSFTIENPLIVGNTIKFTTIADKSNTFYEYSVKDLSTGNVTIVKRMSTGNTYNWIPAKAGNYRVTVKVKNTYSNNSFDQETSKDIEIKSNIPTINTFNVTGTFKAGAPVNVEMTGSSLNGVDVKFSIGDRTTDTWTTLKGYDGRTSAQIPGLKNGVYRIVGEMRDKSSNAAYQVYTYKDIVISEQPSTLTNFKVTGNYTQGSAINLEAAGTSANGVETKFWISDKSTGKWTVIKDYSSTNVLNYTMAKPGNYRVVVHMRDKYSRSELQVYDYKDIEIKSSMPSIKAFNVTGTFKAGSPVNVEMTGTSANGADIKFSLGDRTTDTWTTIKDYDGRTNIQIPGLKNGTYRIVGEMRDKSSNAAYQVYDYKDIVISEQPSTLTNFKVTGNYTQGSAINIEASGTSANGVETKFWISDKSTGKWTVIKDYSSTNVLNYTMTKPGNYRVVVHMRDKYSRSELQVYDYKDIEIKSSMPSIKAFNVTGTFKAGSPVNVEMTGTSANGVDVKFSIGDRTTDTWTTLKGYDGRTSIQIPGLKNGVYRIVGEMRDKSSNAAYQVYDYKDIVISEQPSTLTSFKVTGNYTQGSAINIEAAGTSANGVETKFWISDMSTGKWTVIKDYSSTNALSYTMTKPGNYRVVVHMRDKYSRAELQVYDYKDIEIKSSMPSIKTFNVTGTFKAGSPVNVEMTGTSANGVDVKFSIGDRTTDTWTTLKGYDGRTSIQIPGLKNGTYRIVGEMRDKSSDAAYQVYDYKDIVINEQPSTLTSFKVTGEYLQNKPINIEASGTSANGVEAKFWINDKSTDKWIVIKDYNNSNSLNYTITKPGQYRVVVHIRDKYSRSDCQVYDYKDIVIRDPNITQKTIVIDPGHGGKDPGAIGTHNGIKYNESFYNLQIALKLKAKLESLGYKVVMTRNTESEFLELNERADLANSVGASLFVSIHHDSYDVSSANGLSTHYSSWRPNIDNEGIIEKGGIKYDTTPTEAAKISAVLANRLAFSLSVATGYYNRGSSDHNLYVTRMTNIPSLLIECGFITNSSDILKITNPSVQDTISTIIANEINKTI